MSTAKEPVTTKFFSRNWSYLRWPEPTYMRVAYVFESRFLAGTIYPFVMILASLIKNRTLRKRYLFFSRHKNV